MSAPSRPSHPSSLPGDASGIMARIAERFDASHSFTFAESCVMLCYVGSTSHGTSIPNADPHGVDDVDLMAVVLPPPRYVVGLDQFEVWVSQWDELDVVVYGFHKFVRLLVKSNPNVLGTLWLREIDYVYRSLAVWLPLEANRHLFATKAAHGSFAGYASGQMQKMTAYSREIQDEIDTLEAKLAACGWKLQDVMDKRSVPMPYGGTTATEANAMADRLRHLRAKYHAAYMGEKRRGLVMRHGYDTKNAAHLIRLLRMCIEFLETGSMAVYRTHDAEELKAIKRGEWALDDVKALADALFTKALDARNASSLPFAPDVRGISDLIATITLRAFALDPRAGRESV